MSNFKDQYYMDKEAKAVKVALGLTNTPESFKELAMAKRIASTNSKYKIFLGDNGRFWLSYGSQDAKKLRDGGYEEAPR